MTGTPDDPQSKSKMNAKAWTFLLIGAVFATALVSLDRLAPSQKAPVLSKKPPKVSPEQVPLVMGTEPLSQIFIKAGCPVCHTIPGVPGAHGKVGPRLTLRSSGPTRLADPRYTGDAETVKEYVIESILKPRLYVVKGYPDRTMPTWYGRKLTAQALDKIAAYLETLSDGEAED